MKKWPLRQGAKQADDVWSYLKQRTTFNSDLKKKKYEYGIG